MIIIKQKEEKKLIQHLDSIYQGAMARAQNAGVCRPCGENFFGPRLFWLLFWAMQKSDKAHDGQSNNF